MIHFYLMPILEIKTYLIRIQIFYNNLLDLQHFAITVEAITIIVIIAVIVVIRMVKKKYTIIFIRFIS